MQTAPPSPTAASKPVRLRKRPSKPLPKPDGVPRWTQESLDEYRSAAAYYEMCQPGLGKRFMQYVDGAEAEAMLSPERPRLIHPNCHRVRLAHFPYNFLYTLKGDYGLVLALMHQYRQPGYWHQRIE